MASRDNWQTPPRLRRRVRSGFAPCCRGRRSCQAHFTRPAYSGCFSIYAFTNGHLRDRLQPVGPHLVERVLDPYTDPLAPDQFFKESVSMLRIDQASPSLAPPISSIFHCPPSRTRL